MIRTFAGLIVLACLAVPLRTILANPERLSALPSLQVDAAAYDAIAAEVARTRSLAPIPPTQPPGFVLTMAAVYLVAGHTWLAGKMFLWLVFVVCVALAARLAWRMYGDEHSAWAAALLTATAPALHGYVATIQYEVMAAAWLLVLVLSADRARAGQPAACALLGLSAAAASLTRETLIVTLPALAIFVAHLQYQTRGTRHAMICALVIVSCAAAPVAAWTMLQTARSGRVVPISDKGPVVMASGNNPQANGTFNAPLAGVGEPSGLAFIRAEPARFVELAGRKFLYFWGVHRDGWNVPRRSAVWAARALGGAVPLQWLLPIARGGWVLALLLIALALWPRSTWRRWWILPAAVAAVMCVHLLTLSSHRFAVPTLPIVFAITAAPVMRIARWLVASRYRAAACIVVVAWVVAMQRGEWPLRYELSAVDTDGLRADNVVDVTAGLVRSADAARGRRAAVLLSDESLPHGTFDVVIRLAAGGAPPEQAIAEAWVQTDAGLRVCQKLISASESVPGQWTDVTMPCTLGADAVATVVVETTGAVDIAFESLRLRW